MRRWAATAHRAVGLGARLLDLARCPARGRRPADRPEALDLAVASRLSLASRFAAPSTQSQFAALEQWDILRTDMSMLAVLDVSGSMKYPAKGTKGLTRAAA